MSWWDALDHADRRPVLVKRGRIKAAIRGYFEAEGFSEVESSVLVVSPGNETHLHAFETALISEDGVQSRRLFLRTSPEFSAKKLLAAGERRIFEFARVFRNRERGRLHAPEFTMLEWYRAGQEYGVVMEDALRMLALAAECAGVDRLVYRSRTCDPHAEPERLSVADAFNRYAGVDLLSTLSPAGEGCAEVLKEQARRAAIDVSPDDDWSDMFSKILTLKIEPELGKNRPSILYHYPVCEAALARTSADDARLGERFELYACGVELANGYGELIDPMEQRRRFAIEMTKKERLYGMRYPIDEDFIQALARMPAASGVALGFDRLVMLATGAPGVDYVMWTPLA